MPLPAFDAYAGEYDLDFTQSRIGKAQRRQVWRAFTPYRRPSGSCLEINCGTGEDAFWLSRSGYQVLATDISEKMLAEARKKQTDSFSSPIFRQMPIQDLRKNLEGSAFDLLWSNFGGLNCLSPEDTQQAISQFYDLLRPGGRLLVVYMARLCWWEHVYFYYKKNPGAARRRQVLGPLAVPVLGQSLPVWYYSGGQLKSWFTQAGFHLLCCRPVGLFVPPSYLGFYFQQRPRLLGLLDVLDRMLAPLFPADWGDHLVFIFEKTPETP